VQKSLSITEIWLTSRYYRDIGKFFPMNLQFSHILTSPKDPTCLTFLAGSGRTFTELRRFVRHTYEFYAEAMGRPLSRVAPNPVSIAVTFLFPIA
jgi:hypothetical protein